MENKRIIQSKTHHTTTHIHTHTLTHSHTHTHTHTHEYTHSHTHTTSLFSSLSLLVTYTHTHMYLLTIVERSLGHKKENVRTLTFYLKPNEKDPTPRRVKISIGT